MSSRRTTYDGSVFRRGISDPKWGDTDYPKVSFDEHASSKRSKRIIAKIDSGNTLFAEDGEKDRYLITYADLITLLLGLFIIMYAISKVDNDKYDNMMTAMGSAFGTTGKILPFEGGRIGLENDILKGPSLKESLNRVIDENNYNDKVQLVESERGIIVRILDDILFNSGEAELSDDSKQVLKKISAIIKNIPNDIRIEGHTDNIPINSPKYASNWHLSVARATNTAFYLMAVEGINQDKVSIIGNAEYKPIANNNTDVGRKLNRRVDIVILKQ